MEDASKVAPTGNTVGMMTAFAGVQNTALRTSDAVTDQISNHLSMGWRDVKTSEFHIGNKDLWFTPIYGNISIDKMVEDGGKTRGNFGGGAAGFDISTANESGGNFTFGFSMHAGGGSSNTHGTVTSAHNKYSFGGAGLHAGYQNGNFNIFGSLSYSRGEHDLNMYLPPSMDMGKITADATTTALTTNVRVEYKFDFDNGCELMPHAGVRHTMLKTHKMDSNAMGGKLAHYKADNRQVVGSKLAHYKSDSRQVVQIPIGMTLAKNINIKGWSIKPMADISYVCATGGRKAKNKVDFSGVNARDVLYDRFVDKHSVKALFGLTAQKGNLSFGINYGIASSQHETDHRVTGQFCIKF